MGAGKIVLGTRGSELALAQAAAAEAALRASGFAGEIERKVIKTSGDRRLDIRLADFAKQGVVSQGAFTKELEDALLAGQIDAAVHSLKDLPSRLAPGFALAAVMERAPVEDLLVTRGGACGIEGLPEGATLATGSVRRGRTAKWLRPDLQLIDIRGNVPTRLRKLARGEAGDATLLARAGVTRLGLYERGATQIACGGHTVGCRELPAGQFVPAAGQGAVGLETLDGSRCAEHLAGITHAATASRVAAERAFLFALGAGCDTPVGVHATPPDPGGEMTLSAIVFDEREPGAPPEQGSVTGGADDPESLATRLLNRLSIEPKNA